MRRVALVVVALAAVMILANLAWAEDNPQSRSTLKGFHSARLRVELAAPILTAGLSSSDVATAVALKLRQAGLTVVSGGETPTGYVCVRVSTSASTYDSLYRAANVRVGVLQGVSLLRDRAIWSLTETWDIDSVAVWRRSSASDLMGLIGNMTDQFLAAYLSENPKPAEAR